jgi:hypothetical protein
MRAAKAVLAGAVLFGLLAVPALGEDIFPPWWRGETETTFEQWEFLTNLNPTPPDPPWVNPYGEPSLMVFPAFPPPDDWFPEYLGGLGVWLLSGEIIIEIPNDPIERLYKEIWIQVTWSPFEGGGRPAVELLTPPVGEGQVVREWSLGPWTTTVYSIHIEPNPDFEEIWIYGDVYVDEIVVDTICSDEDHQPAIPTLSEWGLAVMTLLVLTAGTLVFMRARRPAQA